MKLTVKTLKGSHFEIRVQPSDTVSSFSIVLIDNQDFNFSVVLI